MTTSYRRILFLVSFTKSIISVFYKDICIGWRFAGLYYKADTSVSKSRTTGYQDMFDMKVDQNLIHDIVPQLGGGNESLTGKHAELRQ